MDAPDSKGGESDSKSHWAEWHWCVGRGGVIGNCIRVLQRNRTNKNIQMCVCVWVYVYRDRISWLLGFWKLRSPTSCHLQVGESGELVVKFSLSLKPWELGVAWGRANGVSADLSLKAQEPMSKGKRRLQSQLKHRECICLSTSFLLYPGPQWIGWGPPILGSLYYLLNQMLIFSGNTLIDTPRNNTFTICLGIAQPSW